MNSEKDKEYLNKVQTSYSYKQAKENKYQAWKRNMYLEIFTKHMFARGGICWNWVVHMVNPQQYMRH